MSISTEKTVGCVNESKQPDVPKIKYHFECTDCGTHYESSQKKPPPSPRWVDGHVCNIVLNKGQ
jgi:hypothetical protein